MGRKNHKHKVQPDNKVDYKKLSHWSKIEDELQGAMVVLLQETPNRELEKQYDDYLSHNELELAYQTLKKLGEAEEQLPEFEERLAAAAKLMKMKLD